MTESSAKNGNNSVLRKLANDYSAARSAMEPEASLTIRIVSNQPASDEFSELVRLGASGSEIPENRKDSWNHIVEATGLSEKDLVGFLQALNLSECGAMSRFAKREAVMTKLATILASNVSSDILQLVQRIRELMLPERHGEVITIEVLLSWFGIADRAGLFPCPQAITGPDKPIPRASATQVAQHFIAGKRLVALHGPGGCGKTTTVRQVANLLPEGSVAVLFDCYGGGRYLFSNEKRHLPQNAYLQIINDVAMELGSPYFLCQSSRQPVDIRGFLTRLRDSASLLADSKPGALLLVIVDAADNSVTAAERQGVSEPCFVPELCGADLNSLPGNVRFLISARTARRQSVGLPRGTDEVKCPAFTLHETTAFVLSRWPAATSDWIEQFHALSNGVPRVQNYAVSAAHGDQSKGLDALRPSGKGLNDVLRSQFDEALKKIGESNKSASLIGALAVLPPPIPPQHLAAVAGCSVEIVDDFVRDLLPGLQSGAAGIFTADEDFGDFIRAEVAPSLAQSQTKAATHLFSLYLTDPYAATHVADSLIAARRGRDLLTVLDRDAAMQIISDPIVRREVHLRRLKLALASCKDAGAMSDVVRVVLLSAEANRDEYSLKELLKKNSDLAMYFAGPTLRRLVLSDREHAASQGSILCQDAVRAAWTGDRVSARECIVAHEAWMRRRKEITDENIHRQWSITHADIAARVQVRAELQGIDAAVKELLSWRPRRIHVPVAHSVIFTLIVRGREPLVADLAAKKIFAGPWNLMALMPLAISGCAVARHDLADALSRIRRRHIPTAKRLTPSNDSKSAQLWHEHIVLACEMAIAKSVNKKLIKSVLKLLRNSVRDNLSATRGYIIDAAIRCELMARYLNGQAITQDTVVNALLPKAKRPHPMPNGPGLKRKRKKQRADIDSSQRDELAAALNALAPVYVRRFELVLKKPPDQDSNQTGDGALIPGISDHHHHFESQYWARGLREQAAVAIMQLMALSDIPPSSLYQSAEGILGSKRDRDFDSQLLPLLRLRALRRSEQSEVHAAALAAASLARSARSNSSQKVEFVMKVSRLLLPFAKDDAAALFSSAVDITKELDREALEQISLLRLLRLLSTASTALSAQERKAAAEAACRFITGASDRLDSDGFPWDDGAEAIARLSIPFALASASRWVSVGRCNMEYVLPAILKQALVSCLRDSHTKSFDGIQDVVG